MIACSSPELGPLSDYGIRPSSTEDRAFNFSIYLYLAMYHCMELRHSSCDVYAVTDAKSLSVGYQRLYIALISTLMSPSHLQLPATVKGGQDLSGHRRT